MSIKRSWTNSPQNTYEEYIKSFSDSDIKEIEKAINEYTPSSVNTFLYEKAIIITDYQWQHSLPEVKKIKENLKDASILDAGKLLTYIARSHYWSDDYDIFNMERDLIINCLKRLIEK